MASISFVRGKWRALIRSAGQPERSRSFELLADAKRWARTIEAERDAWRSREAITVGALVRRYRSEVHAVRPLGRNKADVLSRIEAALESTKAQRLDAERVVRYIRKDRGISGVTAAIDLSYLKTVLKIGRSLWRIECSPGVVDEAREILRHMGLVGRSNERDRRPTADELLRIKDWLRPRSACLTPDAIDFALASCLRLPSEIVGLRWADLNERDRTIVVRDRKDPRRKLGNHQTVPLLNGSFEIAMRQPRTADAIFPVNGKSWSSLFPRACRACGISGLRLYDLRHEAISRLVESGRYSIPEMMLVTGHRDPKQLMRYTQLRARDLHR